MDPGLKIKFNEYNQLCEIKAKQLNLYKTETGSQKFQEFSGFSCRACGCKRIQFTGSRQLRSADEGETIFFICGDCGSQSSKNL